MSSEYIFDYLDDIWDLMPAQDRSRFAETWKAYEQTYGDVWSRMLEMKLSVNIDHLPLYSVRRWNSYVFDSTTVLSRQTIFRSPQDFSLGINISNRYLIKVQIDGGVPVEIDLRGANPSSAKAPDLVRAINEAVGYTVAYSVLNDQQIEIRSPTVGTGSSVAFYPAQYQNHDASEVVLGLDPALDLPKSYPLYPYEYLLPDSLIAGIPVLQNKIIDNTDSIKLKAGVDFFVEFGTGVISFNTEPVSKMWAPDTLYNNETPYNNYGYLLGIYDQNTERYLKAVKGLWYAFWTGPRPENIRRSLYLLFGLPTASAAGTVGNVSDTSVVVNYDDGTSETFQVPADLSPIVNYGQRVSRFEPLVNGIRVFDKVNYPGFVEKEVQRYGIKSFLTPNATLGDRPDTDESKALRLLEANTYLPQIDISTFISPDIKLSNVRTFLSTLQPRSRTYMFQVLVGRYREKVNLLDEGYTTHPSDKWPNGMPSLGLDIKFDVTPNVDWNPNTEVDQNQLNESESNDYTKPMLITGSYITLDEGWCTGDKVFINVFKLPEGDTISGSDTVSVPSTEGIKVGMAVSGGSIPPDTVVVSVVTGTQFKISHAAEATETGVKISILLDSFKLEG